MLCHRRAN